MVRGQGGGWTRRRFGTALGGLTVAAAIPTPAVLGQAKPRLVVVGGGAGGLAVARSVAAAGGIEVVLVEEHPRYAACFWSNHVYGGLTPLDDILYGYDGARAAGVDMVQGRAAAVDRERAEVRLADGERIGYDRLLLAPGIDFRAVPGYDAAAARAMPHAYASAPEQHRLLWDQLQAMPDGGHVVIAVPDNPYRCPPAPYERVSLVAHWLTRAKPKSKILVLDAKNSFLNQTIIQRSWNDRFPGMIEWLPVDFIGPVSEVDAASRTLHTDFDAFSGDVVNFIPPQRAGEPARSAGLTDAEGFCPVIYPEMRSRRDSRIFVVGDAVEAHTMPKSATAAMSQAESCAGAIRADLLGARPSAPDLSLACYSFLGPRQALINGARYAATADGGVQRVEIFTSEDGEPETVRRERADEAEGWYRATVQHLFG